MFGFSCIDGFRVLLPALPVSWLAEERKQPTNKFRGGARKQASRPREKRRGLPSAMRETGEVALAETVDGDAEVARRGGRSGFLAC